MKNFILTPALFETTDRVERIIENYSSPAIEDLVKKQRLTISFSAAKAIQEILVRGAVSGELTMECSRCLSVFPYPVSLSICQSYPLSEETIDVEDEVRQLLILNLPVKPLCRDLCKGICPACGRNKNIDHCACPPEPADFRWSSVGNLIKKD